MAYSSTSLSSVVGFAVLLVLLLRHELVKLHTRHRSANSDNDNDVKHAELARTSDGTLTLILHNHPANRALVSATATLDKQASVPFSSGDLFSSAGWSFRASLISSTVPEMGANYR